MLNVLNGAEIKVINYGLVDMMMWFMNMIS